MTETIEQLMDRLRAEYLAGIPSRLDEMRAALQAWRSGEPSGTPPLPVLFHRLSGSAGAHGFGQVTMVCREMESWLATHPANGAVEAARLCAALAAIEEAFSLPPTTAGIH